MESNIAGIQSPATPCLQLDGNVDMSLDGDTLLGSPEPNRTPPTKPTACPRRPIPSGRIEKSRVVDSPTFAARIIKILTYLPTPKRSFFTASVGLGTNLDVTSPSSPLAQRGDPASHLGSSEVDELAPAADTARASVGQDDSASDTTNSREGKGEGDEKATDWREEQLALNIVLRARNEFTLLPSTWRYNLRGIPIPDGLFYTKTKSMSMRPRIYARQDKFEYQGETAFRKLIDVHAQIRDLRKAQTDINVDRTLSAEEKQSRHADTLATITSKISQAIERACAWAEVDGDLRELRDQVPPNIMISVLPDKEEHGDVFIQEQMDDLARRWRAKLSIPESESRQAPAQESIETDIEISSQEERAIKIEDDVDHEGITTRQREIHQDITQEVEGGRTKAGEPDDDIEQQIAPVVFGFVIFKHTLMVVTLDANDPSAPCNIPISLNMAESNQHQWNALAIMVTICWARDLLTRVVQDISLEATNRAPSEDPDA